MSLLHFMQATKLTVMDFILAAAKVSVNESGAAIVDGAACSATPHRPQGRSNPEASSLCARRNKHPSQKDYPSCDVAVTTNSGVQVNLFDQPVEAIMEHGRLLFQVVHAHLLFSVDPTTRQLWHNIYSGIDVNRSSGTKFMFRISLLNSKTQKWDECSPTAWSTQYEDSDAMSIGPSSPAIRGALNDAVKTYANVFPRGRGVPAKTYVSAGAQCTVNSFELVPSENLGTSTVRGKCQVSVDSMPCNPPRKHKLRTEESDGEYDFQSMGPKGVKSKSVLHKQ